MAVVRVPTPTINAGLHPFVVGASAAFGDDPIDDLVGISDVARLAMNAIGCIDF